MNVQVRIRDLDDEESVYLCHAPWDQLEALRYKVASWGIHCNSTGVTNEVVGQFVIDKGQAYFELICGEA
jgi:hypothetical protein